MSLKTRLTITAIFIAASCICLIILKIIEKRHKNDPVFQEEKRQREEAYKKRMEQENEELKNYTFSDSDYSDNDRME